ncbi:basic proline-rich protein-like [Mustela lutreola]|uniref:basic proline-rich protein-like n=1 Tax=Mustela lutreola TaxID=9666 RepID=UPI0027979E22|nr:basic proline-rich protein-like [Mustela lutreola]
MSCLARTPWTRGPPIPPTRLCMGSKAPAWPPRATRPRCPIHLPRRQRPQNAARPPPLPPPLDLGTRSVLSTSARRPPALRAPGCTGLATGVLETRKRLACCVGRESNPGQLLGRQLCSPLYHQRCTARAAPRTPAQGSGPGACTLSGHRLWPPPPPPSTPWPCPDDPPIHSAALLHGPSSGRPPSHPRQPHAAGPLRGARPPANRLWEALAPPGLSWSHRRPPTPLLPAGKPGLRDPRPSGHALPLGLLHRVLAKATSPRPRTARHTRGPPVPRAPPRLASPCPVPSRPPSIRPKPPPQPDRQRRITGSPGHHGRPWLGCGEPAGARPRRRGRQKGGGGGTPANLLRVSRTPVARPRGSREPGAREAGVLRWAGTSALLFGASSSATTPEAATASVPTEGPPTDARTADHHRGLDSPAAPGPPVTSDPLQLHPEARGGNGAELEDPGRRPEARLARLGETARPAVPEPRAALGGSPSRSGPGSPSRSGRAAPARAGPELLGGGASVPPAAAQRQGGFAGSGCRPVSVV